MVFNSCAYQSYTRTTNINRVINGSYNSPRSNNKRNKNGNIIYWDVNTVDVYPTDEGHSNVIYNVHWRLNAVDTQVDAEGNPYTAVVYGTQVLDTSDLSGFIDFDSVTSAEVQGWVESAMGEEQVQTIKIILMQTLQGKSHLPR
jgi:hypothetical protein